jgi:hypothetical protein
VCLSGVVVLVLEKIGRVLPSATAQRLEGSRFGSSLEILLIRRMTVPAEKCAEQAAPGNVSTSGSSMGRCIPVTE